MPQVWDIEDLVDAGERSTACSYFVSRELLATARIVFCPYNYLVDPCVRAAMDVNLKSSVRGSGASVEVPSLGLHPHCTLLLPRGVVWCAAGRLVDVDYRWLFSMRLTTSRTLPENRRGERWLAAVGSRAQMTVRWWWWCCIACTSTELTDADLEHTIGNLNHLAAQGQVRDVRCVCSRLCVATHTRSWNPIRRLLSSPS